MKTFAISLASLFATMASAEDLFSRHLQDKEYQHMEAVKDFAKYGDCIALGPAYGVEAAHYVESDIQFAQQVREELRGANNGEEEGKINANFVMDVNQRYFDKDGEMIAQEVKMSYGNLF